VFSKELQESLSTAAQQKRIGESKVIAAQAEGIYLFFTRYFPLTFSLYLLTFFFQLVDAAKLMKQAAELLNSPAAMVSSCSNNIRILSIYSKVN
jgi:hypothetical protein